MLNSINKLSKFRRSNLFEYFYYFLLVALTIIFILGGSMYFYFSAVLRNEAINENNNTLEQLKNAQESILSEIDKTVANIVLDPYYDNFIDYYYGQEIVKQKEAQDKMTNIVAANEYIESFFIFYPQNDIVLASDQGVEDLAGYYDSSYVKTLDYRHIRGDEVQSRLKRGLASSQETPVVSFMKPIPLNYTGSPKAIVVVNIKGIYLKQMLDSIKTNNKSNIVITNKDGSVISTKKSMENSLFLDIVKTMNYKMDNKAGSVIKKINGENLLVSYIFSQKYGWMYIYTIPVSEVTSSIKLIGVVIAILCILMILLSLIGSFFLSKKIYSPIKSIMSLINKNSSDDVIAKDQEPIKETAAIQKNINSLIDTNITLTEKNKSLKALLYDFEIYQKNKFLKNLMEGTMEGDRKLPERLSYYQIDLFEDGYFVAFVVSIDNYDEFLTKYSEKQQNMLFIYISECAANNIFRDYKGFTVETSANEIVILVNFNKDIELGIAKSSAYNLANLIHETIDDSMKYTFTIGVSEIYKKVENIHQCYCDGVSAANFRLLLGHNHVIFYENVKCQGDTKKNYPFTIERNILNSLKSGDMNGVMSSLKEFTGYIFDNQGDDMEYIRHYFLQLLSATIKCIYELDKNLLLEQVTEKDIYSAILKMETMQSMEVYVKELYGAVLKNSEQQRNLKNNEIVTAITTYINNNLNSDLSMDALAEKFYISSSHLRKIFKDETGRTIKEYIDEERINKAKELLLNSHLKVHDISEQVGYLTLQAFTRAFRLSTGKSPGEYRVYKNSISKNDFD